MDAQSLEQRAADIKAAAESMKNVEDLRKCVVAVAEVLHDIAIELRNQKPAPLPKVPWKSSSQS
jgi:hypothetical protein